jgi:hypothetical protein
VPEWLDKVTVTAGRTGEVTLTWEVRDALLAELAHQEQIPGALPSALSLRPIRATFEAVGATRPVELTIEQKMDLFQAIGHWQHGPGGDRGIDMSALIPLRRALREDIQDYEQRQH